MRKLACGPRGAHHVGEAPVSSPRTDRQPDNNLHEYAERRAESGRVVPVAGLVLPATLRGYTLVFRARQSIVRRPIGDRLLALMELTNL